MPITQQVEHASWPSVPERMHCKICRSESDFVCSNFNEHGRVSAIHTFRCRRCGIAFVGNRITPEDLREAYTREDIGEYYAEIYTENHKKHITAAAAAKAILACDTRAAILDIGCGNGEFAQLLVQSGFLNVSVHELPSADLQSLRNEGIGVYQDFNFACMPSNSFDLITLLDVAEHVVDPVFLFRQCRRILRPGGYIYLHTPVVTVLDRFMQSICQLPLVGKLGRVWQRGRVNIFHLQNFTKRALSEILTAAHFDTVRISIRNELSWPVRSYVRVHVCEKHDLPAWVCTVLSWFLAPIVKSNLVNRNKAIVSARRSMSNASA